MARNFGWMPACWEQDNMDRFPPSALDVKPGDPRVEWYALPDTPLLLRTSDEPFQVTVFESDGASGLEVRVDLTETLAKELQAEVATAESFRFAARFVVNEWEKTLPKPRS